MDRCTYSLYKISPSKVYRSTCDFMLSQTENDWRLCQIKYVHVLYLYNIRNLKYWQISKLMPIIKLENLIEIKIDARSAVHNVQSSWSLIDKKSTENCFCLQHLELLWTKLSTECTQGNKSLAESKTVLSRVNKIVKNPFKFSQSPKQT